MLQAAGYSVIPFAATAAADAGYNLFGKETYPELKQQHPEEPAKAVTQRLSET